ncbi:hypothetical protein AB1Y20_003575 [Prymnesium parvum]|uniref:Uncharacterized protein n=1 Tax=Prymnesium parvum TaxID=97485 RepID=A0AB34J6Z0_PRYPA
MPPPLLPLLFCSAAASSLALHAAPGLAHAARPLAGRLPPARMRLDVSPSVANQFRGNVDGAILVEKVVVAAQTELAKNPTARAELGKPIKIEQCVGAGVRPNGVVMVRFFSIFSKSGKTGSSYSCNVSATGRVEGGKVVLTKLSCAKDEGWGRTIDII